MKTPRKKDNLVVNCTSYSYFTLIFCACTEISFLLTSQTFFTEAESIKSLRLWFLLVMEKMLVVDIQDTGKLFMSNGYLRRQVNYHLHWI